MAPVSYVETTPRKEREPSDLESAEGESLVDDCGKDDGVKDETCHQCRYRLCGFLLLFFLLCLVFIYSEGQWCSFEYLLLNTEKN